MYGFFLPFSDPLTSHALETRLTPCAAKRGALDAVRLSHPEQKDKSAVRAVSFRVSSSAAKVVIRLLEQKKVTLVLP